MLVLPPGPGGPGGGGEEARGEGRHGGVGWPVLGGLEPPPSSQLVWKEGRKPTWRDQQCTYRRPPAAGRRMHLKMLHFFKNPEIYQG